MTETQLDQAHAAMQADARDSRARLGFYDCLAGAELFLLLRADPDGDQIDPETFEVEAGTYVLVFDREERLAGFVGQTAPYAALSGRRIAEMVKDHQIGLGLNLGVAPSSILIPPDAVAWLSETLADAPEEVVTQPISIQTPRAVPDALLTALDRKLATAGGLAQLAYLVSVTYAPARPGHLLAFVDPVPGAEPALGRAVREALVFSGLEAGELDIGYFTASDPITARLAKAGLRIDLPAPEPHAAPSAPSAPGMDPDHPPILR